MFKRYVSRKKPDGTRRIVRVLEDGTERISQRFQKMASRKWPYESLKGIGHPASQYQQWINSRTF